MTHMRRMPYLYNNILNKKKNYTLHTHITVV